MLRARPGLRLFLGGLLVFGLGFLVEFTLDAIVGAVLIVCGMLVMVAFMYPADWDRGWPPRWLDQIWNVWIRGRDQ